MKSHSPKYTVFTGAVHYPADYLYYLSFITQGREHWFLGSNLKSGETTNLEALNWYYVLGGHIGYLLHISPVITYQLLVVLSSILYMSSAYSLLYLCFPKQPRTRLAAFILFLLSNAFPKITHINDAWDFGFFYPANNLGHPFIRLSNVPHHTLISATIMGSFSAAGYYWQHKKKETLILLLIAGLILGSMQPIQWGFVTGILFFCAVLYKQSLLPILALSLTGLPFALYIKSIYGQPLYTFMLEWEKNQQIYISIVDFILLHGPVMLLGLLSVPFLIRAATIITAPIYLYSIISLILFFSRIPETLGYLNTRFISVIPILLASYCSAVVLRKFAQRFPVSFRDPILFSSVVFLLLITIPVTYAHIALGRTGSSPDDLNTYLPLGAYQTYQKAAEVVAPNEITLVAPLFTLSFPAFTGRHVFVADKFGTIDYERKGKEGVDFLNTVDTPEERNNWLHENNILYIFTYAWTPITDMPGLSEVYKNDYAILYKVR